MIINLPEPEFKHTPEEKEKMFWDEWKFNSHRFEEYQKGYYSCSFCGTVHTSMRAINDYHICEKNPYIKEAMQIYAKEQNAELLEMLNSMIEVFEPLAKENNIGIDAAKRLIKKATL